MKTFNFPDVGEGINEADIVAWLVKEGDSVKEDQNIVKVETDKAIVELPSPATGVIKKIYKKPGETITVGSPLVDIDETGSSKAEPQKTNAPTNKDAQGVVGTLEVGTQKLERQEETPQTKQTDSIKVLPSVRKKANENGINLSTIKATGKNGQISEHDLEGNVTPEKTIDITKKYDLFGYIDHIPLQGLRKKIRENMEVQARIPMVTHMDDANVSTLHKLKEDEKEKHPDLKLTYLPFIIKAAVQALKKHPYANASITDTEIILKKYYNIGIAVATADGLLVPVIKGANDKTINELAKELHDLGEKARARTIDIMDLKGGTFTITNVGSIGGTYATPVLTPGESAILALGKIQERAIIARGQIRIAKIMPLSLTFDHRIFDGADAADFMNTLKEYLEDPTKLLLDSK